VRSAIGGAAGQLKAKRPNCAPCWTAIETQLVNCSWRPIGGRRKQIVLDLDAMDDLLHGQQ
jgi:hypothetical protein